MWRLYSNPDPYGAKPKDMYLLKMKWVINENQ
jgi:hypothetical protein